MAKVEEKKLARKLRKEGKSILDISRFLHVSKGSVSTWCSDIILSQKQIMNLHESMVRGGYIGRMAGAQVQKQRKQEKIQLSNIQARKEIQHLAKNEVFFLGLGLYWGEGDKKSFVRFFNSDPKIISFMMQWFREVFDIKDDEFMMYLNLNEEHKERAQEIIKYWSKITGISVKSFRKPSLVKVKQKKEYDNMLDYKGTLCIGVAKSKERLYKILGWIEAIKIWQGSSAG